MGSALSANLQKIKRFHSCQFVFWMSSWIMIIWSARPAQLCIFLGPNQQCRKIDCSRFYSYTLLNGPFERKDSTGRRGQPRNALVVCPQFWYLNSPNHSTNKSGQWWAQTYCFDFHNSLTSIWHFLSLPSTCGQAEHLRTEIGIA